MWSTHRRLERASRLKRLVARRDGKHADEALKLAHDRSNAARVLAAPVQRTIDVARAAIDGGESSISTLRALHRWGGNGTRLDRLIKLDVALSAWRKWAAGGSIDDAEVANAVETMKAYRDGDWQQPLAHLADAVVDWSERAHPAQLPQPAVLRGLGLEL